MVENGKPNSQNSLEKAEVESKPAPSNSVTDEGDSRLASIQNRLLQKARDRAESESQPPESPEEPTTFTTTRIGHSSFPSSAYGGDEGRLRAVEEAETLPSFRAPSKSEIDKDERDTSSKDPKLSNQDPSGVLLRAQVVVTDAEPQETEERDSFSERRESRRVILRDSQDPPFDDENANQVLDGEASERVSSIPARNLDDSANYEMGGMEASLERRNEDFAVADPFDVRNRFLDNRLLLEPEDEYYQSEPKDETGNRASSAPKTRTKVWLSVAGLAFAVVAVFAISAIFDRTQSRRPDSETGNNDERGGQEEGQQSTRYVDSPTTSITSEPEGAEVLHQGAVIGNTPIGVPPPSYEELYLLRLPGYESQLVRISPNSSSKIHIRLKPVQKSPSK